MNDNVLPMGDLGDTDPWHGDNSLRLWYHEVGFMDGDIKSIIGTPSIVDWQYWLFKRPVWDKKQAALLVLGIDPDEFSAVERHVDYLTICKPLTKLMRLMPENLTRPLEWLTWFNENGYFDCFQVSLRQWFKEQPEIMSNIDADNQSDEEIKTDAIKSALITPRLVDDEKLAALFDPVTVEVLNKMFPSEKWVSWALHPKQNGLIVARQGRALYNPYKAGQWFVTKKIKDWDSLSINRVLAKNLPPRSRHDDGKYLLTGDQD